MHTDKKRVRRDHSPALKVQILAECEVPGASVAKVALAHRINANIVHGWCKLARQAAGSAAALVAPPAFVPMVIEPPTPAPTTSACIDIELRRGPLWVRIAWPLSATAEIRTWMLELLR